MESQQQKSIFELNLSDEGKSTLSSIAQWAFINSIVGFISLAVTILSTVMVTYQVSKYNNTAAGTSIMTVLISMVVSLLLNITLITAANYLKKGLASSDQGYFNAGIAKMASYFKIMGILMIILLVICTLVFLVVLLAGASGGFR